FAMPASNIVFKFIFMDKNIGMDGIAFSSLLSMIVAFILICLHFVTKRNTFSFIFPKQNFISNFLNIIKYGATELNSELSYFGFGVIANLMLSFYVGPDGLVAFSLLISIIKIGDSLHFGINQAGAYLCALMYGEEDRVGLRQSLLLNLSSSFSLSVIFGVFLFIFPRALTMLFFVDDPEASQMAVAAVSIYALTMPFGALVDVFRYYFNSIGRILYSNILCSWYFFFSPVLFMLITCPTLPQDQSDYGVWFSYVFSVGSSWIILILMVIFTNKKMNVERGYVLQGFMNNVMLLPVSFALDWLYTVQFRPIRNLDDAVKISQNCHKVLQREQYDRKKSYIFALAIEEMARNTLEQGFKKQ
ncbi:MAG: hypothetical protein HUJ63_04880, partial [Enterococcus sp.]|nr:hypothetical protein [Enterococcus sp.]